MIKSKHEKLGDEELDLKIDYPEIKTNKDLRALDGTIKKFVADISRERYSSVYDKNIHSLEMEALNKNKEKIELIVDYVVNLNKEALVYKGSNVLIYNFHRNFDSDKPNGQIVDTLDFKKTYIILQLIEWGVNPFEIRRCLKSNGHDNFNWNKFMEYVMDNKDILEKICANSHFECEKFYKSMNMIRAMYLFEPLFKNNGSIGNVNENLKPLEIGFLLQDLFGFFGSCNDGMYFILNYLNELEGTEQNNKMKDYLLKIPDGYLWKNFLLVDDLNKEQIEEIEKMSNKENTMISLSHLMVGYNMFNFDKKDFEKDKDFWFLISNLNNDSVLIGFFTLVAIRKISFTERQMDFIAAKINDQIVTDRLRKINQSLKYKAKSYTHQYGLERRVKFGPVTAFLDYVFLKMSRGIGYLGAALFNGMLCIPAIIIGGGICFGVVCVIFLKLTAIWTITFWISASILSGAGALFFVCCFIGLYYNDLRSRFGKFADGMEEFYNEGKIVYWLESYNINHPINDIGEPPEKNSSMVSPYNTINLPFQPRQAMEEKNKNGDEKV